MKTAWERAEEFVQEHWSTGATPLGPGSALVKIEHMLNEHATDALHRAAEVATDEAWRAHSRSMAPDAIAIAEGILALRPST